MEAVADILDRQGICRLTDLARRFAVSHVTVHRIIERLKTDGVVSTEPYQPITLTPKGRRFAARCRERHEIVYRFLLAIGLDKDTAAIDAEGIEHHVSPLTLKRFRALTEQLGE